MGFLKINIEKFYPGIITCESDINVKESNKNSQNV
jgi:hypothetical protein